MNAFTGRITAATDRDARIDALIAGHRAKLDLAERITDLPTVHGSIANARKLIRDYAISRDAGMLGRNGIAPWIDSIVASAERAGFTWRELAA